MFGKSLHIDLYNCKLGTCDDLELTYRFLEELVDRLHMTLFAGPIVVHGPRRNGVEVYPEKAGISGVVFLIESSITIHTICPKQFVSIDVYTCGELNQNGVEEFIKSVYGPQQYDSVCLERGKSFD